MVKVSPSEKNACYLTGTLQNLRVNGTLPFTKIGGVIFYEYEEIKKMLEKHRHNSNTAIK